MAILLADDERRRFRSVAPHYVIGRPPYAPLLLRRVAALVALGAEDAVLDLGCGPGQLARGFAPMAGRVVGMDPEPEMLRVAATLGADIPNLAWETGGSAELGPQTGRFRLVVMGRSFHWMDRAETLRRLDAIVVPDGAVALFHTTHTDTPENAWVAGYDALRRGYDTAGSDAHRGPGWVRHEAFLLDSAFHCLEAHAVIERRSVAEDTLVLRALSMSSSSPERIGERRTALEREMRAFFRDHAGQGVLTEIVESHALIGRRAAA
ncbi:MAG: class I SAM-dependent methyltransferase [Rhodospirillales bacterium]|nr:class I SAM-dependent methyltransferase [Rhodospirillales bacterium]MBN8900954.1 class I SAM-dependent methyltransferase [Rhodospirillales bacterium]MBN8905977.1 class I SAM-dependent methyltransferase [Rhodospirillales bacterium]